MRSRDSAAPANFLTADLAKFQLCFLTIGLIEILMLKKLMLCLSAWWLIPSLVDASFVTVNYDAGPDSSAPDSAQFNGDGLLYAGNVGSEVARTYLQFNLPSLTAGMQISSAILRGTYDQDYQNSNDDGLFSWYLAANDSWSEATLTWNNQPGTTGSAIASWNSAAAVDSQVYSWDITSTVNQQYQGDGVLSLVLRSNNEGSTNNFQYWWSRENNDGKRPFEIEYTVTEIVAAVPEATSFLIWGLLGLTVAGCGSRRRSTKGQIASVAL